MALGWLTEKRLPAYPVLLMSCCCLPPLCMHDCACCLPWPGWLPPSQQARGGDRSHLKKSLSTSSPGLGDVAPLLLLPPRLGGEEVLLLVREEERIREAMLL